MSFYNTTNEQENQRNNYTQDDYEQYIQNQMNSQQEQSRMSENQQSVIRKLLSNDHPFNLQVSDYQKKLILHENSRLTMKAAQQITSTTNNNDSSQISSDNQSIIQMKKSGLKSNKKINSLISCPIQNNYLQQQSQQQQQQLLQLQQQNQQQQQQQQYQTNSSENNKNVWEELYEKGLKKKMMVELQMKQSEQERLESQIQELTFQPKLIADSTLFNINQPFQERNSNWQDAKNKKLANIKKQYTESEDYQETKECTFQPQILNKSRQMTYQKINKKTNENIPISHSSQDKNNQTSSYKQAALKKQDFIKQKQNLHKQLQDLEINL